MDKELGQHIRSARKRRGLTITRLAVAANVSVRTLELLEVHGVRPGPAIVARLCAALGLDAAAPPAPPVRSARPGARKVG